MFSRYLSPRPGKGPIHLIPDPPKPQAPTEPAPIAIHVLDFQQLGLAEYEGKFAMVIDNIFSEDDCQRLLQAAEASGDWEVAQINGGDEQYTDTSYRNSGRIMLDDHALADWILSKIHPYLSDIEQIEHGTYHAEYGKRPRSRRSALPVRLTRLNERLRFLQYGPGQFFKPHCDGVYITPDEKEMSYYTLQIYLNGSAETLKGGATRFWPKRNRKEGGIDVESRTGRVLVFEHEGLWHSGEPVLRGSKISMRTDFMYEADEGTVRRR